MLALGVILASDVFQSGPGIETLLFGSLLLVEPRDLVLAGAASVRRRVRVAACSAGHGWRSGFDPAAARALGVRRATYEPRCWCSSRSS